MARPIVVKADVFMDVLGMSPANGAADLASLAAMAVLLLFLAYALLLLRAARRPSCSCRRRRVFQKRSPSSGEMQEMEEGFSFMRRVPRQRFSGEREGAPASASPLSRAAILGAARRAETPPL